MHPLGKALSQGPRLLFKCPTLWLNFAIILHYPSENMGKMSNKTEGQGNAAGVCKKSSLCGEITTFQSKENE